MTLIYPVAVIAVAGYTVFRLNLVIVAYMDIWESCELSFRQKVTSHQPAMAVGG